MKAQDVWKSIQHLTKLVESGVLPAQAMESQQENLLAQITDEYELDKLKTLLANLPTRSNLQQVTTPPVSAEELVLDGLGLASEEELAEEHGLATIESASEYRKKEHTVELNPGLTLCGQYELLEELGTGGMGQVFLAEDLRFGGRYSLKVFHPWMMGNKRSLAGFVREFKLMEALTHPNVVRVFCLREDLQIGVVFYVMEYVEGLDLQAQIDQHDKEGNQKSPLFSMERSVDIIRRLCRVLHYIHREKIVHRDLKPGNIILSKHGDVKLFDFGIAKSVKNEDTFHTGYKGTFFYIAPEQLVGGEEVKPAADVFSLGVIMYQLLTGEIPVGMAVLPSELNPKLNASVDEMIRKAMHPRWEKRYQTMREFANAIQETFSPCFGEKAEDSVALVDEDVWTAVLPRSFKALSTKPSAPNVALQKARKRVHRTHSIEKTEQRKGRPSRELNSTERTSGKLERIGEAFRKETSTFLQEQIDLGEGELSTQERKDISNWSHPNSVTLHKSSSPTQETKQKPERLTKEKHPHLRDLTRRKRPILQKHALHSFSAHYMAVTAMALSGDVRRLASASTDKGIKIWELGSWFLLSGMSGHKAEVRSLAWGAEDKTLVSASSDRTARIWDVSSGKLEQVIEHPDIVSSVLVAGDGYFLVSGCYDHKVRVWELEHGRLLATFEKHRKPVTCLALHPNQKWLLSGSLDGQIHLWELASGKWLRSFACQAGIQAIVCCHDPSLFVCVTVDGHLFVWNVESGNSLQMFRCHVEHAHCLIVGAKDRWVATGGHEGEVRLWDMHSGDFLLGLIQHESPVRALCSLPEGKRIFSGSEDCTIRLWDTASLLSRMQV